MLNLNLGQAGWTSAWLKGRKFKDFVAEVAVKKPNALKGYAGLSFRGGLKVFFRQKGRVQLTDDRGGAHSLGESVTGFDIERFRRLKLVCVGPIVRVYVDGKVTLEAYDPSLDREGPVALTTHSTNAYFDDLKISPKVPPKECVIVEPVAEDNCLVFAPGKEAKVRFKAANFSAVAQQVTVGAQIMTWQGKALTPRLERRITIGPRRESNVELNLGALAEGYYKMVVDAECAGKKLGRSDYPFAVHHRPKVAFRPPTIPLAPYWKYPVANMKPIVKSTYMHAAAYSLRKHHFNAVVAGVGIDKVQVDILKEYGIAVVTRGLKCIDEPSVIAGLIGDEPKADDILNYKKRYDEMRAKTDKPLTTCMIGESAFRWYGLKKNYYNLRNRLVYKNILSFVDTLVIADTCDSTPYWVILPSFGRTDLGAYYCNPLPSEMTAMMHLSMAYGADGLLFFSFQPQSPKLLGLVEAVSLQPQDGKYEAMARVNAYINRHARLIKSLKSRGIDVRRDNPAVEVVGLDAPEPDAEEKAAAGRVRNTYIYAVNKDNARTVRCRIFNLDPNARFTCVFTGEELKATKETVRLRPGVSYETGVIRVSLEPGEGRLIRVRQEWAQPAPIKYPAWVAAVPEAKTIWLVDLKPTNTPRPGWLPKRKDSWKKKTWAEMNGPTRLYADLFNPLGIACPKSLYAQAETTIVYDIPAGCSKFVAAAGLGNRSETSSVVFKVIVDGKEKFNSGLYRCGRPILPVIVDVKGAKELRLVTTDGGDGIGYDYAWWGDALAVVKAYKE